MFTYQNIEALPLFENTTLAKHMAIQSNNFKQTISH